MIGHRGMVGIAVLCSLALSAIAASSAFAVTTGYTAFTCAPVSGTGTHNDAHCKEKNPNHTGNYSHKTIPKAEITEFTITGEETASNTTTRTPAILEGTTGGLATKIECNVVHGEGAMENGTNGEEMYAEWLGNFHYTECEVVEPVDPECEIKEETIKTNNLVTTTKGQGMDLKIVPFAGNVIAAITIEKCKHGGLNNTFQITGSYWVTEIEAGGTTLTTTTGEVTAQNTLKIAGNKAGLGGSVTMKARKVEGTEPTSGVAVTTPDSKGNYNE